MNERLMELTQNRVFEARRNYEKASLRYMGHRTYDEKEEQLRQESEKAWNRYMNLRNLALELGVPC